MQNPRRRNELDDEAAETTDLRESPPTDADERDPLPPEPWIDRDYPIHPGIPGL